MYWNRDALYMSCNRWCLTEWLLNIHLNDLYLTGTVIKHFSVIILHLHKTKLTALNGKQLLKYPCWHAAEVNLRFYLFWQSWHFKLLARVTANLYTMQIYKRSFRLCPVCCGFSTVDLNTQPGLICHTYHISIYRNALIIFISGIQPDLSGLMYYQLYLLLNFFKYICIFIHFFYLSDFVLLSSYKKIQLLFDFPEMLPCHI